MERVNLQEGWRFAKANSNEWTPVSVPGTVLSGLLEAGKMQDPYYRENEYEARELLAKDYVFETDFCISEEQLKWIFCSRRSRLLYVRLIGSSFASRKSTEGAAFGRHPPERRATLWISYGIRSRNG